MLINRVSKTLSVDKVLLDKLRELSKQTRIPQSKLVDEALELLFAKYQGGN